MVLINTWLFWQQTGLGLINLVGRMALIIIPLMIFMELLKDLHLLDLVTQRLHWTVRPFGLPTAAVFPLLVGLVFGIAWGAGLIIQAAKDGTLTKRDLYLISLFLVINHSAVEDTLLFAAIGAKGLVVLTFRFVASIVITWFVGKFIMPCQTGVAFED